MKKLKPKRQILSEFVFLWWNAGLGELIHGAEWQMKWLADNAWMFMTLNDVVSYLTKLYFLILR